MRRRTSQSHACVCIKQSSPKILVYAHLLIDEGILYYIRLFPDHVRSVVSFDDAMLVGAEKEEDFFAAIAFPLQ